MLKNIASLLKIGKLNYFITPANCFNNNYIRNNRFFPLTYSVSFGFSQNFQEQPMNEKTFQLLVQKLRSKVIYAQQLQKSLSDQQNTLNAKNKQQARIQISQLTPIRNTYEKIKSNQDSITEIKQMMKETKDQEEKKLLKEQLQNNLKNLEQIKETLWDFLLPEAKYDNCSDIIVEMRPGAGGAESSIFVKDMSDMYEAYCSSQGWKHWISSSIKQSGVSSGYKALDMRVQGDGVHKMFKSQSGVHKVIRIPETEAKGRLHSSTISVVVMPVVPFSFQLDLKQVKYQFTRSSGPGGQAVNKIQSACRAIHIPTGLQVFIQEERSQDTNKKRATELLKQKLFEIQYKKSMQQQQSRRKSQVTTLDRSQKIRTYNYPQDRITDHRTGLTKYGIKAMMSGQLLEQFYESYNQNIKKQQIKSLTQQMYQQAGLPFPKK